MKTTLYTIECISNLHVGSGEDNFGVVDNLIQRDPLTQYPCINASSLKGALRDHCKELWNKVEDEKSRGELMTILSCIFGSAGDNHKASNQGNYRFLDAHLLAFPKPDKNKPYTLITCDSIEAELKYTANLFGITLPNDILSQEDLQEKGKMIEIKKSESDEEFQKCIEMNALPVISRNCLEENNKNLWYEEVLPRKSKLYFYVMQDKEYKEFEEAITKNLVQIGANATIGYGLCKITKVCESSKKSEL